MATIVRVKRRRHEDPLESLVISCKRKKEEQSSLASAESSNLQSSLKFAGTISSKVEGISKHIRDAIRKEKLQKEYKQHTVNLTSKNRQRHIQASQNSRLKIISSFRNIDLDRLDKQKSEKTCTDTVESVNKEADDRLNIPVSENECNTKTESENRTKNCNGESVTDEKQKTGTREKVYQLLDVEIDQPSSIPTYESILKESQSADNITCNSVPLEKHTVQPEDFVYDLYYTNNQDFNFKALESNLTIQTYDDELIFADDRNFTNEEIYEDEDDSNDEDNWRNDYPDEDPHIYENDEANYYDDVTDNIDSATFDHQDHNLADWMSSRCNLEDGYESDDENGSSYDRYYRMIKEEVDHLD